MQHFSVDGFISSAANEFLPLSLCFSFICLLFPVLNILSVTLQTFYLKNRLQCSWHWKLRMKWKHDVRTKKHAKSKKREIME